MHVYLLLVISSSMLDLVVIKPHVPWDLLITQLSWFLHYSHRENFLRNSPISRSKIYNVIRHVISGPSILNYDALWRILGYIQYIPIASNMHNCIPYYVSNWMYYTCKFIYIIAEIEVLLIMSSEAWFLYW